MPVVSVYIPTPYRHLTGGQAHIRLEAGTVGEVLEKLIQSYPSLRERLLDNAGEIQHHLNVFVNDEEVRSLEGKETPLKEGDQIALIPAMAGGSSLTEEQIERYSRHIILPEVGGKGQQKLLKSRVLIIGAGGLGSPAALYLAAAGVGTLGLVDFDRVDLSNLQRQILHHGHDIGRLKVESAQDALRDINPDVRVVTYPFSLTSANALEVIRDYDVVINGCDNFPTRYLVNDACVLLEKPLVDGSIFRFEGQATVFLPGKGCYRCLYPSPPPPGSVPSCAEAGVLGVLPGLVGIIQAAETLKLLLGLGSSLAGKLLFIDALEMNFRQFRVPRNPSCPVCGKNPTIRELIDYEEYCGLKSQAGGL
ncbi:ubiquitin-like small modifier protein 1 [Moorellaceae bacterium AZ2]